MPHYLQIVIPTCYYAILSGKSNKGISEAYTQGDERNIQIIHFNLLNCVCVSNPTKILVPNIYVKRKPHYCFSRVNIKEPQLLWWRFQSPLSSPGSAQLTRNLTHGAYQLPVSAYVGRRVSWFCLVTRWVRQGRTAGSDWNWSGSRWWPPSAGVQHSNEKPDTVVSQVDEEDHGHNPQARVPEAPSPLPQPLHQQVEEPITGKAVAPGATAASHWWVVSMSSIGGDEHDLVIHQNHVVLHQHHRRLIGLVLE